MPTFKLTPQVESDLIEIGIYTEGRHGIKQRNTYLTQLDNRFQWLGDNSGLGLNRYEVKEGYNSFLSSQNRGYKGRQKYKKICFDRNSGGVFLVMRALIGTQCHEVKDLRSVMWNYNAFCSVLARAFPGNG